MKYTESKNKTRHIYWDTLYLWSSSGNWQSRKSHFLISILLPGFLCQSVRQRQDTLIIINFTELHPTNKVQQQVIVQVSRPASNMKLCHTVPRHCHSESLHGNNPGWVRWEGSAQGHSQVQHRFQLTQSPGSCSLLLQLHYLPPTPLPRPPWKLLL